MTKTKYDPKKAADNFDSLGDEDVVESQSSWQQQDSEIFGAVPKPSKFPNSKTNANAIVLNSDGMYHYRRFRMTLTQLIIPEDISPEEFDALGYFLKGMDNAVQFWIGDWANLYVGDEPNDQERGKLYTELADRFGMQVRTIQNYASVCRNLEVSLRRETVSFTHHREVAELPESLKGQEEYFLTWTENNDASVSTLKKHIADTLAGMQKTKQHITKDSFLFSKDRFPKPLGLAKIWSKAKNGDKKAKSQVLGELAQLRKWADEVEESLGD